MYEDSKKNSSLKSVKYFLAFLCPSFFINSNISKNFSLCTEIFEAWFLLAVRVKSIQPLMIW